MKPKRKINRLTEYDYAQSGAGPSVNTPETALDVLKLTLGEL